VARYYRVSPKYWMDEKTRSWDDSTRLLALYLLTCPHRNLEGLYRLPISYATADLGWSAARVRRNLDRLVEDGFVEYDHDAEVVWVRRALHYQAPSTEKQIAGALTSLSELPRTSLRDRFRETAESVSPSLAKAMVNGTAK
jgi:DNA-binding MarR family transcriptional regulator